VARDNYFDAPVAERYDEDSADMYDPAVLGPTVAMLSDLAGAGPVLEFAIGTGRVALPLAARGLTVHGIDLSPEMVAKLREKPGGPDLPVSIGDFTATRLDETFSLVYLVFNTVMNVTTQDAQVECFCNAARHLRPGGRFLIEVMTPELRKLPPGQRYVPFDVSPGHLGFDEYEVAEQRATSHHWFRDGDEWRTDSTPFRYAWPAEFDLMARIAGMSLEHRWADWDRSPFTDDSTKHISVWRKPDAP
jgi:SAM-dependent methyltransferase